MASQEPTGASQPSKPRRPQRARAAAKPSTNGARSSRGAANSQHTVTGTLSDEGIFELHESPPEGLEPVQQAGVTQHPAAAGSPPPELIHPKFGRTIHVSTARFIVAMCSIATLIFVVVATFVTLWQGHVLIDELMRVLEVLFAPLVALVGVAVAFYYKGNAL